MQYTVSDYLYQKASLNKIPLFGCLELSPVCNFTCKMCYVRKTKEQIVREGKRIKDWQEWISVAKQCKEAGTLYLLLTGGEPFLYPNFKELYMTLHEMAFILSINSNGTMIDEGTIEWLKKAAPSRINITLYGSSRETYRRICGNPDGYDKAVKAILMLKEAGIPVVINASMIPENAEDMKDIIEFGKKHKINTRVSTYMFPPVRREKETNDSRFSAEIAAKMCIQKYEWQLGEEAFRSYLKTKLNSLAKKEEAKEDWGQHKEQYMKCRAGRSAFWISWDGTMTACGMLPFPLEVYPFSRPFYDCWMELTDKVRMTTVLEECSRCNKKEICNPCVAMLHAETGEVNKKAPYLCKMAEAMIAELKEKDYEKQKDNLDYFCSNNYCN